MLLFVLFLVCFFGVFCLFNVIVCFVFGVFFGGVFFCLMCLFVFFLTRFFGVYFFV